MRGLVIVMLCGLSACSGSLTDSMGPGVSSFSDQVTATETETSETTLADEGANAQSTSVSVTEPDPGAPESPVTESSSAESSTTTPLTLDGWAIETPATRVGTTPFFSGWIKFPGSGSETFADNVTAEVVPASGLTHDEIAASMVRVIASVAPEVEVGDPRGATTASGLTTVSISFDYLIGAEPISAERILIRGSDSSLLLTLTAVVATVEERRAELAAAVAGVSQTP